MDESDPTLRSRSRSSAGLPIIRSRRSSLFRIVGLALLLTALARIGVAAFLPHAIVSPPPLLPKSVSMGYVPDGVSSATQMVQHLHQTIQIAYLSCTPDSFGGDEKGRGTIFLLHGHGNSKESQIPIAQEMMRRGYRVIIPDLPAHGESEGEFVTFGVVEGVVISGLIDSLIPYPHQSEIVVTWGHSLGGATAIHAAARNERIDAVVSGSTFSSLREVVPDYFSEFLPFYPILISEEGIDAAITEAGKIAGFNADAASTTDAAAGLNVPLLIIHGEKDQRMPPEHARRILDAADGNASLMLIPDADHTDVYLKAGVDSLTGAVLDWIEATCARR